MTHAFLLNETEIKKNCLMIYAPETIKKSLLDYCLNAGHLLFIAVTTSGSCGGKPPSLNNSLVPYIMMQ